MLDPTDRKRDQKLRKAVKEFDFVAIQDECLGVFADLKSGRITATQSRRAMKPVNAALRQISRNMKELKRHKKPLPNW